MNERPVTLTVGEALKKVAKEETLGESYAETRSRLGAQADVLDKQPGDLTADEWQMILAPFLARSGDYHERADALRTRIVVVAGAPRQLTLRRASEIRPTNPTFLHADGRIPMGAVTVVAGIGGLGKTTYTNHVAAITTKAGHAVLIVSTEDDWETTIAPRLIAAGANLELVSFIASSDGESVGLRFPDDLPKLEEFAGQIDDLALIILDPISAMVNVDRINNNDDANVRSFMDPLGRIARKHRCAIVGVAHFNKRANASAFLRLAASGGYWNSVRSVLVVAEPPDVAGASETRYVAHAKCNVGPLQPTVSYRLTVAHIEVGDETIATSRLVEVGPVALTAEEIVNPPERDRRGERTEVAERLLVRLWREAHGPIPATEAKGAGKEADISESTMERARKNLGGTSEKRHGFTGGWSWVPPEGSFADGTVSREEATPSGGTDAEKVETPTDSTKTSRYDVFGDRFNLDDDFGKASRRLRSGPENDSRRRHEAGAHPSGKGRVFATGVVIPTCSVCSTANTSRERSHPACDGDSPVTPEQAEVNIFDAFPNAEVVAEWRPWHARGGTT